MTLILQEVRTPPMMGILIALLLFAIGTSACGQEKPKKMISGPSIKELIPDSLTNNQDGITQITFGQLFKPGPTEYTHVGAPALKDAPPFPTGYVLFKDLVYSIKTEAIISGNQLTVFSIPSAENETEFSRLSILHLEDDEMSPAGYSWAEVTVFPGGWNERFHFVPKARYDALQPDFKSKRIAAITGQFGLFAIALAPDFPAPSTGPFTKITVVVPSSSPDPAAVGEKVFHTIVLKNEGPNAAAEVNVKAQLDPDFDDVSATSTQGRCKESHWSSSSMVCYLGAMPAGATATMTIVGRLRDNVTRTKELDEAVNDLEVVSKANSTDFVEADNQIFMRFNTRVLRKRP